MDHGVSMVPRVEIKVLPMAREPGEAEEWPAWEVRVKWEGEAPTYAIDVLARDQEHARAMIESVNDAIRVLEVKPLEMCDGCETCLTFGGCGTMGALRELRPGTNATRWLAGLCQRLGDRLTRQ